MQTTWSDDLDSSLSDDEEYITNICFMAIESDNETLSSDYESDLSYNELHDGFKIFYDEYKK